MFEQILVPLDGSDRAEEALTYAERLAAGHDGTMHLVRVVELPAPVKLQGVGAPVNVYEQAIVDRRRDAMAYLERTRARVERSDRPVRVRLLDGDAGTALVTYLREAGIDLVVMATDRRTGVMRRAQGRTARRIERESTTPVLLVPVDR